MHKPVPELLDDCPPPVHIIETLRKGSHWSDTRTNIAFFVLLCASEFWRVQVLASSHNVACVRLRQADVSSAGIQEGVVL